MHNLAMHKLAFCITYIPADKWRYMWSDSCLKKVIEAEKIVGVFKACHEHHMYELVATCLWSCHVLHLIEKQFSRWLNYVKTLPQLFSCFVLVKSVVSSHPLHLAGRCDLFVLRANTSIGQRSFSIAAAVVWNALPHDLRSPHISRRQFRSKLKTHLFRQAYNTA